MATWLPTMAPTPTGRRILLVTLAPTWVYRVMEMWSFTPVPDSRFGQPAPTPSTTCASRTTATSWATTPATSRCGLRELREGCRRPGYILQPAECTPDF